MNAQFLWQMLMKVNLFCLLINGVRIITFFTRRLLYNIYENIFNYQFDTMRLSVTTSAQLRFVLRGKTEGA